MTTIFFAHARKRIEASTEELPSYVLEAWAAGDAGAVKISVKIQGEPGADEVAEVTRNAVGQYRYCYQQWATRTGHTIIPPAPAAPGKGQPT